VDLLRGHKALGQEERSFALLVFRHVHHQDSVSRKAPLNEDVSDLDPQGIRNRLELAAQRVRACVREDDV
jgi:hypothetical protein